MAYYGMTNEYVKETNAANKVKKDIERQEILKEEIKIADKKESRKRIGCASGFLFYLRTKSYKAMPLSADKAFMFSLKGSFISFSFYPKSRPLQHLSPPQ